MCEAVDRAIDAITRVGADALVVALGFDAHAQDPIGVLTLGASDFAAIATRVRAAALPTLIVQEGGYAIDVLADCLIGFIDPLRR